MPIQPIPAPGKPHNPCRGPFVLAIDQGTTSTRAILFDERTRPVSSAQREFAQHYPRDGWIEHDPEEIWETTLTVCREALDRARASPAALAAIGITNQRETTILWERKTGRPLANAIVWQDRRTARRCARLRAEGWEDTIRRKTGLLPDPYFSATKLAWLLENIPGARRRAEDGELAFGTVDSFLLWRLTGGHVHRTDATNASRTMLFNIHTQDWDDDLLDELDIPRAVLPSVCDSSYAYGVTAPDLFGVAIPVSGMAGDQQAALFGQACFSPGMAKSTYGTGCFLILNTGDTPLVSQHRLLTTVGYRLEGRVTYALEGSIFVAGAVVKWLRDKIGLIGHAAETEEIARRTTVPDDLFVIPAFAGLGAPHWDPEARGAILGMTLNTDADQLVTAALHAICHQTRDLVAAINGDGAALDVLRVDGGMAANNWFLQTLADRVGVEVHRPRCIETTALGAALLAGMEAGVFGCFSEIARLWKCDRTFSPDLSEDRRDDLYARWRAAVARVLSSAVTAGG